MNGECPCWVGHGDCGGCSGYPGIKHEPACGWELNPDCRIHNCHAVREQRDRKPPDRQCGEENASKWDVGPLMYTPIAGVRCSECKSNDIIAVDENGGVSFHCVICDRQVGHLESSPEVNKQ